MPSGTQLQESAVMNLPHKPQVPWLEYTVLNLLDSISKFRAKRWGVDYQYMFLDANGKELEEIAEYVEMGSLKPVVGSRVDLKDIQKVRTAAEMAYTGKGGIGKTVIQVQ